MAQSQSSQPLVHVGYIEYGASTAPYLSFFIKSLEAQTYSNFKVVSHDNTPGNGRDNIGFSRAYNKLISEARLAGAEYFLIINPDTIHEPDMLAKLVAVLEADEKLGSVSPKVRQWDFAANRETERLDTCGLVLKAGLRFRDAGQGEVDRGQHDHDAILGPSGAAGLFRLSALDSVASNGQFYDERFFMYKEDCDLAYRLHKAGFASQLISEAIVYHDRTATGGSLKDRFLNRRTRSKSANRYSFINQHFLYIKYWHEQSFFGKMIIYADIVIRFFIALVLEQYLLLCYKEILRFKNI